MVDLLTNVNALFLTQSTNGTRDLNWGTNSEYKSYEYFKETYLNAIKDCVEGASPLSLGSTQTNNNFKIACYENTSAGLPLGQYFYGMGLVQDTRNALGLFATGANHPDLGSSTNQTGAGYEEPIMVLTQSGTTGGRRVGINTKNPLYAVGCIGSGYFSVSFGSPDLNYTSLNAGTVNTYLNAANIKTFGIPRPEKSKQEQNYRLRHWCIEGDECPGALIYRRQFNAVQGRNVIQMPDWFKHLVRDVMCFTSNVRHLGSSWADLSQDDPNKIILETSKAGIYNVMITARGNNECLNCPTDVECIKEPEPEVVLPEEPQACTPCEKHP